MVCSQIKYKPVRGEIAEELKETMEKQAENEKVLGAGENPAV